MALQTSGSISLNEIFVEANSPYASGQTSNVDTHDIRYLVEATGKDINKTAGTQISFSDFYGATKFEFGGADDSSSPSYDTAPNGTFTQTYDNTSGGQAYAGTRIQVGPGTDSTTVGVTYHDDTSGPSLGTSTSSGTDTFTFTINPYYDPATSTVRNANHGLEWRWAVSGLNIDYTGGTSSETVHFGYFNVAAFVSQQSYTGNNGDVSNASFTTSWRTWNPIPSIALNLKVYASSLETTGPSQTVVRLSSGGYMRIEFRQKDDATTADHHYVRKNYVSGTDPRFQATSYEEPDDGS